MAPVWHHGDPPNAWLTDKPPSSRGGGVGPSWGGTIESWVGGLAGWGAGRSFVRPFGLDGDEQANGSGSRQTPGTRRFDTFPSARGRSVWQASVRRVSQSGGGSEQTEFGRVRLPDRAPIEPPPNSQPAERQGASIPCVRPPLQTCADGAEGGRGAVSHDSQGFATHHVRTTEPRCEGTPISLTGKARPAAPR